MVSSHFELRFQLNFNQVTMDWQRRSFLRNKSPIISLDASNVEKEMDAEQGYLLGWSSDSDSEFDPDEYDWELEVDYMYIEEKKWRLVRTGSGHLSTTWSKYEVVPEVVPEVVLGALNRMMNTMKTLKIGMIIYGWFLDIWMKM